jgi:hypothetical protein
MLAAKVIRILTMAIVALTDALNSFSFDGLVITKILTIYVKF